MVISGRNIHKTVREREGGDRDRQLESDREMSAISISRIQSITSVCSAEKLTHLKADANSHRWTSLQHHGQRTAEPQCNACDRVQDYPIS